MRVLRARLRGPGRAAGDDEEGGAEREGEGAEGGVFLPRGDEPPRPRLLSPLAADVLG